MISFWETLRTRIFSRHYLFLFFIFLVGISSIVRANRSYLDDVGRSLYGYADWVAAARPMTEFLSWLFFLGGTTVDASPLTQVIAVAVLALVCLLLLQALRVRVTWPAVLCTVPVGLSPYGLENLSYKFDAPFMALALLFAVLPCCFFQYGGRVKSTLVGAVCLFIAASLYQPALGAYLCIVSYVTLTETVSGRKLALVLVRLWRCALPFIIGVGVYTVQAPFWFVRSQYTEYVSLHASVPPLSQLPAEIMENIPVYFGLLLKDWTPNGLGFLLALLFLLFSVHSAVRLMRRTSNSAGILRRAFRLPLLILLLICFVLTPFGIQFFLSNPVWAPRTFQGFGIMVSLMLLSLYAFARRPLTRAFSYVVQGLLIVQLVVFANVYGNLLDAQNQWELSRLSLLSRDLNGYIQKTGSSVVSFVGSVGLSPLAVMPATKFPLLERLVTVPLTRDWRWGYEQLITFGVRVERRPLPPGTDVSGYAVFLENPAYRIQEGPNGEGVVSFLPPPVPRPVKRAAPSPSVEKRQ